MNTVIPPSWEVRRHQAQATVRREDRWTLITMIILTVVNLTILGLIVYGAVCLARLVRVIL